MKINKEDEKNLKLLSLFSLTYATFVASSEFINDYRPSGRAYRFFKSLKEKTSQFAEVFDEKTTKARNEKAQLNMVANTDMLMETIEYISLINPSNEEGFMSEVRKIALKYMQEENANFLKNK